MCISNSTAVWNPDRTFSCFNTMAEPSGKNQGLRARLAFALRPKPSQNRLQKEPSIYDTRRSSRSSRSSIHTQDTRSSRSSFQTQDESFRTLERTRIDAQTGERRDDTEMLHSLSHHGFDEHEEEELESSESREPGEPIIASLPPEMWQYIMTFMSPSDAASLAFASKTLRYLLGDRPWGDLNLPENHQYKIRILVPMDKDLPRHLLCFPCASYHLRTQPGKESLKPAQVLNPLFNCPRVTQRPPRTHITPGRTLPFTFVQLVTRAQRYGPNYGIPVQSLNRRWNDPNSEWSHQTRYHIVKGHLLMRCVSTCYAEPGLTPAGMRLLLYSREDYTPYFSVCTHWRDGELMTVCKCAMGHIPLPPKLLSERVKEHAKGFLQRPSHPSPIVNLCAECRPMRRCPECPTEYLIELKFTEDKTDPVHMFKQALSVTRWSDLGDGTSPSSPEWAACNGEIAYDSFATIGGRGVSGIFEAQSTDHVAVTRILSLNPNNEKLGEAGSKWY